MKSMAAPAVVSTPPPSKTPEQAPTVPSAFDSKPVSEIRPVSPLSKIPVPPAEDPAPSLALPPSPSPPPLPTNNPQPSEPQTGDNVDAPVLPDAPAQQKEPEDASPLEEPTFTVVVKEEPEVAKEKGFEPVAETEADSSLDAISSIPVEPSPTVADDSDYASEDPIPVTTVTPIPEPVVYEPKEQPLQNGLPQDSAEAPDVKPESSTNPVAEQAVPQVQQSCLMAVKTPVEEAEKEKIEEMPAPVAVCPVEETTMQGGENKLRNT